MSGRGGSRWVAPRGRVATGLSLVTALLVAACATAGLVRMKSHDAERLVWSDSFLGAGGTAASATRWTYDLGANGWGNGELQCYTDGRANSELDGHGHLVITARRGQQRCADGRRTDYTSARLLTRGLRSFDGGRIVVRAALPSGSGAWPAIWLLGDSYRTRIWPRCGELDVAEVTQRFPGTMQSSVHVADADGQPVSRTASRTVAGGFHDYELRWTNDRVRFLLDHRTVLSVARAELPTWPFSQPFHLLLNVAVGGTYGGAPAPGGRWPQTMTVDYVKAYD